MRRLQRRLLLAGLILTGLLPRLGLNAAALVSATSLKCESRVNPLGLDTPEPRLSWILVSERRGERQTAWQILAASTAGKLAHNQGDVWDSGKVLSADSLNLSYAGPSLREEQAVFWKVRVWDSADRVSDYSEPARFETALLSPSDWRAT